MSRQFVHVGEGFLAVWTTHGRHLELLVVDWLLAPTTGSTLLFVLLVLLVDVFDQLHLMEEALVALATLERLVGGRDFGRRRHHRLGRSSCRSFNLLFHLLSGGCSRGWWKLLLLLLLLLLFLDWLLLYLMNK